MPNATTAKPFTRFECRKTFNRFPVNSIQETRVCPNFAKNAIMMSHRFRSPKKNDDRQLKKVKFRVENGFFFQKIYEEDGGVWTRIRYPSSFEGAPEFVNKYKDQAWTYDT
ncbi:MAG: hypothetical protein OER96_07005 [Gammaproteobacteria bacterium]|nr:hypothetical protein [Gammaproteobacteria bacterium]